MSKIASLHHWRGALIILALFLALFIVPITVLGQIEDQDLPVLFLSQAITRSPSPILGTVKQIVTSPASPNVIVVSLASPDVSLRPRYSLDGGHTWRFVQTAPWEEADISNLAIAPRTDPQAPTRILAKKFDMPGTLYRTGDFGVTWAAQEFPQGMSGYLDTLSSSSKDPQRLYLTAHSTWYIIDPWCFPLPCDTWTGYVYMSEDAGVTWTPIRSEDLTNFGQVVPSPIVSTTAYVQAGGYASSWIELYSGRYLSFPIDTLALDSVEASRLYGLVMDWTNPASPTASAGKTSTDSGDMWTSWPSIPSGCVQLMAHPTKSGFLYLRCSQGIFRSIDLGETWEQLSSLGGDLLAPNYGNPGQLLWARSDGLWVSNDDGLHWIQLTSQWNLYQFYLPIILD